LNYKTCFIQLEKIKNKAKKVAASEKVVLDRLTSTTATMTEMKENEKLCQTLNKLKFDVDSVLQKCIQDEKQAAQAVQHYIKNITETDEPTLIRLIVVLFDTLVQVNQQDQDGRHETDSAEQQEQDDQDNLNTLHDWILHISTMYIKQSPTIQRQVFIIEQLMRTRHISSWAKPLIQLNSSMVTDPSCVHDYTHALSMILFTKKKKWTEDDYLAVLDQLDINTTFENIISNSSASSRENMAFGIDLQDMLLKAVESSFPVYYTTLLKRLLQTIIHNVHCLLHDNGTNQLVTKLVDRLLDIDKIPNGWVFLSTLSFQEFSVYTVWHLLCTILNISPDQPIMDDGVSINLAPFTNKIHEHPTQGIFMMNCLFNMLAGAKQEEEQQDPLFTYQSSTMAHNIVVVISLVFFTNAFLSNNNKDNVAQIYYKDTRESLASICALHPFITSLLFRFTIRHLDRVGKASLYLFHALPIAKWKIGKDDILRLKKLLYTHQQPVHVEFAKYIIDSLDFGYTTKEDGVVSTSQPWHSRNRLFLTSEIHKELAFLLLSVCHQRLQDDTSNDTMANYIPFVEQCISSDDQRHMEIMQWSWKIATKLKLYDCPVSEHLEKHITPPFLKRLLQHPTSAITSFGALIVYISFTTSATSRHFLQFESMDGWLKLFTILKKGHGVIQVLAEIIPSFVYMHGDDFFNDHDELVDFIQHLVVFKPDPLLKREAQQMMTKKKMDSIFSKGGGLSLVIGSHLWQARFIDSQNKDLCSSGFSYFDLMLHSWLKTLFRRHEWMLDESYLALVDCLCKVGFLFHHEKRVQQMLVEETHRRLEYNRLKQRNNSPKVTRIFKNMFTNHHGDSLLSMDSKKQQHVWFTFNVLLLETTMEVPLQDEVANIVKEYVENPKTPSFLDYFDITTAYKKKPIDSFMIYKWLKHILHVPVGHTLTPLFLQVFFILYFAGVTITKEIDVVYGHVFFTQKLDMKLQLRNHLLECRKYHHEATSGYSETKGTSSLYNLYNAMLNWLDNPAILDASTDICALPSHYLVDRLEQCYKLKDLQHLDDVLWMDLIQVEVFQDAFIEFSWCGSEKFASVIEEDQKTIASLVVTAKKPYCNVVLPLLEINT
jgi:hypothetical protein